MLAVMALLAAVLSVAPMLHSGTAKGSPRAEEEWLARLHAADELELQLGRLAQERASSPLVRRYGDRLTRDVGAADARLMALAPRDGVLIEERQLTAPRRGEVAALEQLSGGVFDRAFALEAARAHRASAAYARLARDGAADARLRGLLAAMAPLYEEHRLLLEFVGREGL